MLSHGFRNEFGDRVAQTATSRNAALRSPSGFKITLIQHIKQAKIKNALRLYKETPATPSPTWSQTSMPGPTTPSEKAGATGRATVFRSMNKASDPSDSEKITRIIGLLQEKPEMEDTFLTLLTAMVG